MKILIISLLFTVVVSGCSWTRIAYRYADWIIMGRIDDAFDLTRQQKNWLEPRIDRFMVFVDRELLPDFISFLDKSLERTKGGLQYDDAVWIRNQYEGMRIKVIDQIADDASLFLLMLDREQVQHFGKYLDEQNEFITGVLDKKPQALADHFHDKTMEVYEDWFGDFAGVQRQQIRALRTINHQGIQERLAVRSEFHQSLLQLIASKPKPESMAKTLKAWSKDPGLMLGQMTRERYLVRRKDYYNYMVDVDQILTEKQRQYFRQKMRDLMRELLPLAKVNTPYSG